MEIETRLATTEFLSHADWTVGTPRDVPANVAVMPVEAAVPKKPLMQARSWKRNPA